MNRLELVKRTRKNLSDEQNTLFTHDDIVSYINEAIERVIQVIPELAPMEILHTDGDAPEYFPKPYHHLLSVYATARCSSKDQRHYEAGTLMNEFETKLQALQLKISNGDIELVDDFGLPLDEDVKNREYVVNKYFHRIDKEG